MYASMIVIMCMCLVVPLSWKKTQMQPEVVWIGWQVLTPHWTVTSTREKREAILDDLNQILGVHKLPIKLLEKVIDKPFMGHISMASVATLVKCILWCSGLTSHHQWKQLLESLDNDCIITTKPNHPTLALGVRLFCVGNCNITSLQQLSEIKCPLAVAGSG